MDQDEDPDPWEDVTSYRPNVGACAEDQEKGKTELPNQRSGARPTESSCANRHARLVKCRNQVQKIGAFYPLDQSAEDFSFSVDTSRYLNDVDVYNNVHAKVAKKGRVRINREWVEPILWCIGRFRWTQECCSDDDIKCRRNRTCTFVELACATDILTGGMCGPKDASIEEKAEIIKKV
jgi:hypothetical protein